MIRFSYFVTPTHTQRISARPLPEAGGDSDIAYRQLRYRRRQPQVEVTTERPLFGTLAQAIGQNTTERFRFALIADTHLWHNTSGRSNFVARSDASPIRDGLLVASSPTVQGALLADLAKFAAGGGAFAVHAGDAVCGGASFHSPDVDYETSLRMLVAAEYGALGKWPIYHVAGNHDLHPSRGGLASWHRALGTRRNEVAYRAIRHAGWRLLLLDTASDVEFDTDGHGSVDPDQLGWLETQLIESAALGEQVRDRPSPAVLHLLRGLDHSPPRSASREERHTCDVRKYLSPPSERTRCL